MCWFRFDRYWGGLSAVTLRYFYFYFYFHSLSIGPLSVVYEANDLGMNLQWITMAVQSTYGVTQGGSFKRQQKSCLRRPDPLKFAGVCTSSRDVRISPPYDGRPPKCLPGAIARSLTNFNGVIIPQKNPRCQSFQRHVSISCKSKPVMTSSKALSSTDKIMDPRLR